MEGAGRPWLDEAVVSRRFCLGRDLERHLSDLQSGEPSPSPAAIERVPRVASTRSARASVHVIEDPLEFDALEEEWNALLDRSAVSVFQSFEWQRTWWKHFGEGRKNARLHIVTLRLEDELVAVAPFYIDSVRSLGLLRLRRLLFVGHKDSDYLDILVSPGKERECVELIAAHLAERRELFDMALLEEITDRSPTGLLLQQAFLEQGWAASRFVDEQCPRTPLRRTWEETVAALPVNYRREIRRRLRNIAKAYEVELELVPPGEQVEPAMREFIDMHQERWIRDGHPGVFADRRRAAFHCEVADRLSRRGWLFLAFLRADGQRCAANYGFSFREVLSTYLPGSRELDDLAKYSPGRVLHAKSMEWAIDDGKKIYDFMRGREHYKYEFDATDVPNWSVVAYPHRRAMTAAKHRLDLVANALRRRARREANALLRTSRNEGWFSSALLKHLVGMVARGLTDVFALLRRRTLETRRG